MLHKTSRNLYEGADEFLDAALVVRGEAERPQVRVVTLVRHLDNLHPTHTILGCSVDSKRLTMTKMKGVKVSP